ncbi:rho-related GTP-binding protein RhoQ-like [Haliotis rubra]|uniref:rho-related GTP-binding protein RhoQ-like n=1 Tax=Haliotis rubra TaxID=36100 RepID=UPI001EE5AF6D|nr:rho-related GTP-binding protein RhoQ-like [Haliotis rubra]
MKADSCKLSESRNIHCALLGDGLIGKTTLFRTYISKKFRKDYVATMLDKYTVRMAVGGKEFMVNIFDTPGQDDFVHERVITYKESEVFVLCFSTCDRESFLRVQDLLLPEIKEFTDRKVPIILVGTQTDLRKGTRESDITTREGARLAKEIGADCYLECSAKKQQGLKEVFDHVVISALKDRKRKGNILRRLFKK